MSLKQHSRPFVQSKRSNLNQDQSTMNILIIPTCNNMPKACLHQEIVRALGLGLRGAKRRRCRLRIRGQIAPAVLSRHSSLKKHRLVPSPLRGRGAFGAVLRASRAILTRLTGRGCQAGRSQAGPRPDFRQPWWRERGIYHGTLK